MLKYHIIAITTVFSMLLLFRADSQAQDCLGLEAESTLQIYDCSDTVPYCIALPLEDVLTGDLTVWVNGEQQTSGFSDCGVDSQVVYSYFTLLGGGNAGPYAVENWEVNGQNHQGEFPDMPALVDSMNVWDAAGNWTLEAGSSNIVGGDPSQTYSNLLVEQLQLPGTFANLPVTYAPLLLGFSVRLGEGIHTVEVEDLQAGCSDMAIVTVTCALPEEVAVQAEDDQAATPLNAEVQVPVLQNDSLDLLSALSILEMPANGMAYVQGDSLIAYAPEQDFCGTDAFSYVVCGQTDCDTATVSIAVDCQEGDIKVYTGFSPNGDGVNEYFRIEGIAAYPDASVKVFNPWGNLVYDNGGDGYDNEAGWDGTWEGKHLTDGNYFYSIRLNDGSGRTFSGYVLIYR